VYNYIISGEGLVNECGFHFQLSAQNIYDKTEYIPTSEPNAKIDNSRCVFHLILFLIITIVENLKGLQICLSRQDNKGPKGSKR